MAGSPQSCFSCGAVPVTSSAGCPACGTPVMPLARACVTCGARLKGKRVGGKPANVYDPLFDLGSLSDGQRTEFSQHRLTTAFSVDGAILLHFATMGLFSLIYFGLMHSKLPMVKHDDFGARRAIGFSFIPFFNLYWVFKFWLRLVARVNLQMRLRGLRPAVSKRFMLATVIVSLIPGANLASLVVHPIFIGRMQSMCNRIVPEASGQYKIMFERL